MPREKSKLKRRPQPAAKPSKLLPALLVVGLAIVGFATLMIRLEVTQEGYRLSELRVENRDLEERNRKLKLEVAELTSHERLRGIATKDGLGPPPAGHVVVLP
ncbi:MAG TPA: cell division protein FtsL [Candidatus Binataceae bacterium]|nr:cell division protein FtsL [Candidatus Binataceae bacterium]